MSLYAVLERYREMSPPEVREEARRFREIPVADALELLALISFHTNAFVAEEIGGDSIGIPLGSGAQ